MVPLWQPVPLQGSLRALSLVLVELDAEKQRKVLNLESGFRPKIQRIFKMHVFLVVTHVFVAFALVIVILLQSGARGGGLSGTFGGAGGTGAIFGGRGAAPFLTKLTAVFASVLIVTCITLFFRAPKLRVKVESETLKEMQKQAEESSQARALSPSSLFEEEIESDSLEK